MPTISIIGSAGRKEDSALVTISNENRMIQQAKEQISKWGLEKFKLVSGGAAFSDHIAIILQKELQCEISLALPCKWDAQKKQFLDNGSDNWKTNPGKIANFYHKEYSKKVKRESLKELHEIFSKHNPPLICWIDTFKGFHDRNSFVAKSDYIIAFTAAKGSIPKDGGTFDTWSKTKTMNKIHFTIGT